MSKQSQPNTGSAAKKQLLVVVGHEKGGVGKSMISANIAVALAMQGMDAVLVDTDSTKSSAVWGALRLEAGREPRVPVVEATTSPVPTIRDLVSRYDATIVDVGARDYQKLEQLAVLADLWIMPTSVGREDLESTVKLVKGLQQLDFRHKHGKVPLVCMFSKVPARSSEDETAREDLLEACPDLAIVKTSIRDLKGFRDASRLGASVLETSRRNSKEVEQFMGALQEALHYVSRPQATETQSFQPTNEVAA